MAKLFTPEIFRKNTAEDYLKAAIDTAEWIDTLAIKTEYGRIWQALIMVRLVRHISLKTCIR